MVHKAWFCWQKSSVSCSRGTTPQAALTWRCIYCDREILQHKIKRMGSDPTLSPVRQPPPSKPSSALHAGEDALDLLLIGIIGHTLFRRSVQVVAAQHYFL